jgi:hypothetical protein
MSNVKITNISKYKQLVGFKLNFWKNVDLER